MVRELFCGAGVLYFKRGQKFAPIDEELSMGSFSLTICEDRGENLPFSLVVKCEAEGEVLKQPIGNGLNVLHNFNQCSVHWCSWLDGEIRSLAFKFGPEEDDELAEAVTKRFVEMYRRCALALLIETPVDVTSADDVIANYIGLTATQTAPLDDYTEPVYQLDLDNERVKATGRGNVCYSESMKYNRLVVVRGTAKNIQLQGHGYNERGFDGGAPELIDLENVQSCDEALMDDTERKLLLLSVDNSELREVDLERGEVVQEFKTPVGVRHVTYSAHVARPDPVYTCLSDNVAFNVDLRIDPRRNVIVEDGKSLEDYRLKSSRKPFTCHATSNNGYLVIGDLAGDIRLYTGPPGSRRIDGTHNPKNAKTLLETKVPVIDIDVTGNGEYVVAVYKKFLLFMRTTYGSERKLNGFASRMGQEKPSPLKLQPTTAQICAIGGSEKLNFTSGGFDRYEGTDEICITACSGMYVFTWSLKAAEEAEKVGRPCLPEAAAVQKDVIGVTARIKDRIVYQTDEDIRMAPLVMEERREVGVRNLKSVTRKA